MFPLSLIWHVVALAVPPYSSELFVRMTSWQVPPARPPHPFLGMEWRPMNRHPCVTVLYIFPWFSTYAIVGEKSRQTQTHTHTHTHAVICLSDWVIYAMHFSKVGNLFLIRCSKANGNLLPWHDKIENRSGWWRVEVELRVVTQPPLILERRSFGRIKFVNFGCHFKKNVVLPLEKIENPSAGVLFLFVLVDQEKSNSLFISPLFPSPLQLYLKVLIALQPSFSQHFHLSH